MTIHFSSFWEGVLASPFIILGGALVVHRTILAYRWFKKVIKGNPASQWLYLWAVSWGLPKLTKDFCHFRQMDGKMWFSPRLERFHVFPRPEDLGN